MIAVTGPLGNTGRLVVEGLSARGVPFRALTRSEAKQKELQGKGVEAVIADFTQPDTLARALDGVHTAYLVCTPDERLVPCETGFIAAAKAAGVKRVVKCSAHTAGHQAESPNLRAHAVVEDALRASGLGWTILRPHGFMQTFFWMTAPMVMGEGKLSYASGDNPIPLIDVRDVGAIAVEALTNPRYDGRAYDLTGPEALTPSRQAEAFARALGRPVVFQDMPLEVVDGMMRQLGVPDAPREHVLWCFRSWRAGAFDYVDRGHEAFGVVLHTYAEFAADLVAGRTGVGPSDFAS